MGNFDDVYFHLTIFTNKHGVIKRIGISIQLHGLPIAKRNDSIAKTHRSLYVRVTGESKLISISNIRNPFVGYLRRPDVGGANWEAHHE